MKRVQQSGFTLIELMIALLILSLAMAVLYGSFRASISAWERGEEHIVEQQEVRIILSQMVREIRSAFLNERGDFYFIGSNDYNGEWRSDKLIFVTALPAIPDSSFPEYDLHAVAYFLGEDNDEYKTLKRHAVLRPYELREKGQSFSVEELTEKMSDEETAAELLEGVKEFKLRYLAQNQEWEDHWQSNRQLPRAVEITLQLATAAQQEEEGKVYRTVVNIPVQFR